MRRLLAELRRLAWLGGIAVLTMAALDVVRMFQPVSKWAVVAYVLAKLCVVTIVFHLVRSQLFPYVDLRVMYGRASQIANELDPISRLAFAIFFGLVAIGASLLIGLLGHAFIEGGLLAV